MVVRRGSSANAAAIGKFVGNASRLVTAVNLATTVITLMTTRNVSDGACGYNLIDELFIIKNYTFCNNYEF